MNPEELQSLRSEVNKLREKKLAEEYGAEIVSSLISGSAVGIALSFLFNVNIFFAAITWGAIGFMVGWNSCMAKALGEEIKSLKNKTGL